MPRRTPKPGWPFAISIVGLTLAAIAFIFTLVGWSRFGIEDEIGLSILIGVIAFNILSAGINLLRLVWPRRQVR
jgi:hypothetical protein